MSRVCSALLGAALLAFAMGATGCQKDIQVPSYDIKIERQEQKQKPAAPAPAEPSPTAPETTSQES